MACARINLLRGSVCRARHRIHLTSCPVTVLAGHSWPLWRRRRSIMTFSLLLPMLVLAPSAPVPPAKPQHPIAAAEVAGHWTMVWGGASYNAHFGEDGSYTCRGPGGG